MDDFEMHFTSWLQGISSEISFWDEFMYQKEEGVYGSDFQWTVQKDKKFTLEEDIPYEFYGKSYYFIDVGSGPFSRCGSVSDKVTLYSEYVDPLAYAYNELKRKYDIDNGVNIKCQFGEMLIESYEENQFDMVHMSNSLDHSFDPVYILFVSPQS